MGRFATLLAVLLGAVPAFAADMQSPRVTQLTVDWTSARAELSKLASLQYPAATDADPLARLNAMASTVFPGIENSGVPVLAPSEPQGAVPGDSGPKPKGYRSTFFLAGPTGYDAVFVLQPDIDESLSGRSRKREISIQISGFSMLYELEPQSILNAAPVKELEARFMGLRRLWHESYLRYAFERYGARYAVSMPCTEGRPRGRWISCRDADRIIIGFLNSLDLRGGKPQPNVSASDQIARPEAMSPDFTYMPPGLLLPNTGFHGYGGRADDTVYARIDFPLAQAPAYANSQSFMNWGNCDFTGRTAAPSRKGSAYRCKINDKPLVFDESAAENRAYPWRDNFCEHRYFFVDQCPGGQGHQGQDIRPVTCQLRNDGADRCNPYLDDVVAVRDGAIMRTTGRESLYLVVNAPGERVRFRYLHMSPKRLDGDGVVSGRRVQSGEILGKVGNFDRIENGTTYHLHFDMQVPTEFGWVFVNPYMTLVSAYERLIGGRGREITDDIVVAAPASPGTVEFPVSPANPGTLDPTNSTESAVGIAPNPDDISAPTER